MTDNYISHGFYVCLLKELRNIFLVIKDNKLPKDYLNYVNEGNLLKTINYKDLELYNKYEEKFIRFETLYKLYIESIVNSSKKLRPKKGFGEKDSFFTNLNKSLSITKLENEDNVYIQVFCYIVFSYIIKNFNEFV